MKPGFDFTEEELTYYSRQIVLKEFGLGVRSSLGTLGSASLVSAA